MRLTKPLACQEFSLWCELGDLRRKRIWRSVLRMMCQGKTGGLVLKKRHPHLVLRKPEATAHTRLKGLEVNKVGRYFEALGSIISELGIGDKPECIWHCDETNLPLSHKPTVVCAKKGTRFLPGRTSGSREGYSVLCTINVAGEDMPPMVVVKGKTSRCLQSMDVSAGVPGIIYTFQKKCVYDGGTWCILVHRVI